jgi:hypothetical protein
MMTIRWDGGKVSRTTDMLELLRYVVFRSAWLLFSFFADSRNQNLLCSCEFDARWAYWIKGYMVQLTPSWKPDCWNTCEHDSSWTVVWDSWGESHTITLYSLVSHTS